MTSIHRPGLAEELVFFFTGGGDVVLFFNIGFSSAVLLVLVVIVFNHPGNILVLPVLLTGFDSGEVAVELDWVAVEVLSLLMSSPDKLVFGSGFTGLLITVLESTSSGFVVGIVLMIAPISVLTFCSISTSLLFIFTVNINSLIS